MKTSALLRGFEMKRFRVKPLCVSLVVAVALFILFRLREGVPESRGQRAVHDPSGYVLSLRFTGQMVAGLRGIFSQHCWLSSFGLPMSIVEPYIGSSNFMHSPKLWEEEGIKEDSQLRLSHYYRVSGINLTSWGTFLLRAPRKLIVLSVKNIFKTKCLEFEHSSCEKVSRTSMGRIPECETSPALSDAVNYLKMEGFVVIRDVCIDCTSGESMDMLTPKKFVKYVFGDYKPEEVTLLIDSWKFSFEITPNCRRNDCPKMVESLSNVGSPVSLSEDATYYLEVIDKLQNNMGNEIATSIAVMVRLEWFLIHYKHDSLEKIKDCLDSVKKMTKRLSVSNGRTRILLALDIGRFGSGSYNTTMRLNYISTEYFESIQAEVKAFVQVLYDGRLSFDVWEESYVDAAAGNTDRSYIAALQSEVAGRAECLVRMGGGHFQDLALQKYESGNPSERQCVHNICRGPR